MKKASDIAAGGLKESTESRSLPLKDNKLDSIRSILLGEDRERIDAFVIETAALQQKSEAEKTALLARITALQEELDRLQELNQQNQTRADLLQEELDHIRQDMSEEFENRVPYLVGRISEVISKAAIESRQSLARALSPVMGEAISNQVRNSQDEMIDALKPIILRTVQKALAEFARDLQRSIDARIKSTLGPGGIMRSFSSRMRGIDSADLVLRDSLPFALDELFLIQRESGLLIDYTRGAHEGKRETELISGMLTAIREFSRDSFGDTSTDEELDEIQYGDQRIIIEGGSAAFLAAVFRGVEPAGFRGRLQDFIAGLHLHYGEDLRDFNGSPLGMPDLNQELVSFWNRFSTTAAPEKKSMSRGERGLLIGGGIGGILILALACFYLQFTIALLPAAFGNTLTPTSTTLPTSTPIVIITPSAAAAPTETPTTVPPSPTLTAPPDVARTNGNVWARQTADLDADLTFAILADTEVVILDQVDDWVELEVITDEGRQRGWVTQQWVDKP